MHLLYQMKNTPYLSGKFVEIAAGLCYNFRVSKIHVKIMRFAVSRMRQFYICTGGQPVVLA